MTWLDVMPANELAPRQKRVVRVEGRQILFLRTPDRIFACPNRCPHEGYPLAEGDCSDDGKLRCNWHNWTFDLVSGATLIGNDALQSYAVKVESDRILVQIEDDREDAQRRAIEGILAALDDADQQRLLREVIRLERAGGSRDEAIRVAISWLAPRLKYGTSHAVAGAADWLALAGLPESEPDQQLAAIGEILGHIADDGRRERHFAFSDRIDAWDPAAFSEYVENGDETRAFACINGAFSAGLRLADLVPTLASCALAHYADFGHSLIYVMKTAELVERLGERVETPLLGLLVRSLCYATREDLVPQFRDYAINRKRWPVSQRELSSELPPRLINVSLAEALERTTSWATAFRPEAILRSLVDSAAGVLLSVDEAALRTTRGSLVKNVSWLDFTHAITFADAGAQVSREMPDLWPDVLLQLACFIGRSHGFTAASVDLDSVSRSDAPTIFAGLRAELFDHGRERFIMSVHLVKTLFAAERLVHREFAEAPLLARALERYFHSPAKGRHVIRTARQMLAVAAEA